MSIPEGSSARIIEVWADNLHAEFDKIRNLVDDYPFVSVDTEYPGIVFKPHPRPQPHLHYPALKDNVDSLKLIQIGLTLTDSAGRLPPCEAATTAAPDAEGAFLAAWQFNFREFDPAHDLHSPTSVELLRRSGIDFDRNRRSGIDTAVFAELLMSSGLVLNRDVQYVSFHGAYDFAYLLKVLTCKKLPSLQGDFMALVGIYFGTVYDVKHMMQRCRGMYGGLNKLAEDLKLQRFGKSHQAGSDSLLTSSAFHKLTDVYFDQSKKAPFNQSLEACSSMLYGLVSSGLLGAKPSSLSSNYSTIH